MQIASVYKLKDRLLIHAESKTTSGIWISCEPFLPLPLDSDASAVGDSVLSALAASLSGVPLPTDWKFAAKARLSAAGLRSERSFMLGSELVTVTKEKSRYLLEPHHNGGTSGDNKGFHPLPELQRTIDLNCGARQIGSAVIEALGLHGPRPNNSFKPTPLRGAA